MIRAVLEGCAFAMRDVVDRLAALGVATDSLLLLGGGARSRIWAQIRADLCGRPVEFAAVDSSPSAPPCWRRSPPGYRRPRARRQACSAASAQTSRSGHAAAYDEAYARYRRLFPA